MIAIASLLFYIFTGFMHTESMNYDILGMTLKNTLVNALAKGKACAKSIQLIKAEFSKYCIEGELSIYLNVSLGSIGITNPKVYSGKLNLIAISFKDPRTEIPTDIIGSAPIITNKTQPFYIDYSPQYVLITPTINYSIKKERNHTSIYIDVYQVKAAYVVAGNKKNLIELGTILDSQYDICIDYDQEKLSGYTYNYTWIGPDTNVSIIFTSNLGNYYERNITNISTGETISLTLRLHYINIYLKPP